MPDYDIVTAIARVEDEMIDSMIRNLSRHHLEEIVEKMNWEQWQVVMLAELEKYKKRNAKKYGTVFNNINSRIESLIRKANENGQSEQEKKILEAIKKGFKGYRDPNKGLTAQFFHVNDRKMEALINATINDMQKAETAILRMANDQFRRIIFDAQVYAATGAATYQKAVDMATKDMLAAGLNCVEYKNGARHRLDDYAEMAIRTASKRAYLSGEGVMRQKWGISLVIINKRQAACPKCASFVGKIMIDDVWSGGSREDGEYPLMSEAVAAGLYHPRCKDAHSTYFKGISRGPGNGYTQEELEDLQEQSSQEAKLQYAERQVEKYSRLEKYSLDKENQSLYLVKKDELEKNIDYMSNSFRPKYGEEEHVKYEEIDIRLKKVTNSKYYMLVDTDLNERSKAVRFAEKKLNEVQKKLPDGFEMPKIAVIDFDKYKFDKNAIGGYDHTTGIMYINSKYYNEKLVKSFLTARPGWFASTETTSPYLHELGHKIYYDSINRLAKSSNISYNEAKYRIDEKIREYFHEDIKRNPRSIAYDIGGKAVFEYRSSNYTEVVAECSTISDCNDIAKNILELLERGD